MAQIRPFRAQRFSSEAGRLEDLVAPPYDVISPEQREALAAKNEHNTVLLTLPESHPDDRSKFVKYGRSSSRLAQWAEEGVLKVDDSPCFYRYRQSFVNPTTGANHTRESLICLLKLEPYEKGVVLPHEQTFPKHKEDRLRLLEATRTHLECIYGLYEDPSAAAAKSIGSAGFEKVAEVVTEDGICHELARCCDAKANAAISDAFTNEKIWIADGHHRYETALNFRESVGQKGGQCAEDYILIALSSMSDPGLILLPTHRILSGAQDVSAAQENLSSLFSFEDVPNSSLMSEIEKRGSAGNRVFGIASRGGGKLATLRDPHRAAELIKSDGSELLKTLDVTVLHEIILPMGFGVKGTDRIEYTRDAGQAAERAESDSQTVAFLMNPPSVEDMRLIALGGEKMPQKSTYYYPKLLSGLVFWPMSEF